MNEPFDLSLQITTLHASMQRLAHMWKLRAEQLRQAQIRVEGVLPEDWPPSTRAAVLEHCAAELLELTRESLERIASHYREL